MYKSELHDMTECACESIFILFKWKHLFGIICISLITCLKLYTIF